MAGGRLQHGIGDVPLIQHEGFERGIGVDGRVLVERNCRSYVEVTLKLVTPAPHVESGPDPSGSHWLWPPQGPLPRSDLSLGCKNNTVGLLERGAYIYMRTGQTALHRTAKYRLENHDVVLYHKTQTKVD
jgi:hypothetical protein